MRERSPWYSFLPVKIQVRAGLQRFLIFLLCMTFFSSSGYLYAQTCNISQITNTTSGINSGALINAAGTCIAFDSQSNITGGNADGNFEIMLYNIPSATISQVTSSAPGIQNTTTSIDSTGTLVTFYSNGNFTGQNGDGNFELFLYNSNLSTFTQVTNTVGGVINDGARINADGTHIVFYSDRDITGENADANQEIFLYTIGSGTFAQITHTTGGSNQYPAVNADGTRIVFHSSSNITGGNVDGNAEIFLYDTSTSTFTQITSTTSGHNFNPVVNSNGTIIAFESSSDITGANSDGNDEIFIYNTIAGTFTQVTNSSGSASSGSPEINAAGTRIAFHSNADLTGNNADNNYEIFAYDVASQTIHQITDTVSSTNLVPSIDGAGTMITFSSQADITGENPDGNDEIFMSLCSDTQTIPTMTEWGMIIFVVLAGLGAVYFMRRKTRHS